MRHLPIVCKGQIYKEFYDSPLKCNINVSDIFSFLISEVGRKVEHYASDLFYDLKMIDSDIKNMCKHEVYLLGIREMGVDSKYFVLEKLKNADLYGTKCYYDIYKIELITGEEMTVTLSKVTEKEALECAR